MEIRSLSLGVEVTVQNVVASAKLGHCIDLDAVVKAYPEAQYIPEVFPGLVIRLKKSKTATLLFRTGGIVCTGAKSVKNAERAVRKLKMGGIIVRSSIDRTILVRKNLSEKMRCRRR